MLDQRRRRWANDKTKLCQCLVLAGILPSALCHVIAARNLEREWTGLAQTGYCLLALEMGRGVPLACSKPDPVPIWKLTPNLIDRLMV